LKTQDFRHFLGAAAKPCVSDSRPRHDPRFIDLGSIAQHLGRSWLVKYPVQVEELLVVPPRQEVPIGDFKIGFMCQRDLGFWSQIIV